MGFGDWCFVNDWNWFCFGGYKAELMFVCVSREVLAERAPKTILCKMSFQMSTQPGETNGQQP